MAKKIKKVVVDAVYFGLIRRKAELLDAMTEAAGGGQGIAVYEEDLKKLGRIQKDWDKADASSLEDIELPYEEPKAK